MFFVVELFYVSSRQHPVASFLNSATVANYYYPGLISHNAFTCQLLVPHRHELKGRHTADVDFSLFEEYWLTSIFIVNQKSQTWYGYLNGNRYNFFSDCKLLQTVANFAPWRVPEKDLIAQTRANLIGLQLFVKICLRNAEISVHSLLNLF
jgi:hypothetical protein